MSLNSSKTSAFRLDRELDFIYDQDCVIPSSQRRRHEELALLKPMTKKIVLNYRASQYGSSLVDALSVGSEVPSSTIQTIKNDQAIKLPRDNSSAVMSAQSAVVRAQTVADVAGINRYKYFHRPLNSPQSTRPASVSITNFQIKPDNIDKSFSDAVPRIGHRNSEPGDSTSSGYQSLKSSNESHTTMSSDSSARRINRRRASRILLQKSLVDRLHYSHTSRSTSRSTEDAVTCRRCWRHASPSQCSLEPLDDGLPDKSTSLPALSANGGTTLRSEKRRKVNSERKPGREKSRSPSRDRLPRASSQPAKKEYPSIIVREPSTDEKTAISLLQKYDQIRSNLDKKLAQISLRKGAKKIGTLVRGTSTTLPLASKGPLGVLSEDVEGVVLNNNAGVETSKEAANEEEALQETSADVAPAVNFSEEAEPAVIDDAVAFNETIHSENNDENGALSEGGKVETRSTPDILIIGEGETEPEGNDNSDAPSDSRTSSEASEQSVFEAEQMRADEVEIMINGEKCNESDPYATNNNQSSHRSDDITINDEASTQHMAMQDAETSTDDLTPDDKDGKDSRTETETDSTLSEEQSLDGMLVAPTRTTMRATQTVLIKDNGELEQFEFIKTHIREDLNALIEAALYETVDSYSRHRANEQFAQYIQKHANAWKDVKMFVGSTLLPESIMLAMQEPVIITTTEPITITTTDYNEPAHDHSPE
uniref:Uncharacterized protein n=1 Tax=Plectus sambesii TaxID=2011161 RepID=A0A914ULL7_9BILA